MTCIKEYCYIYFLLYSDILVFPNVFLSGMCCHFLSSSGEHFSSGTLITDYGTEVFEVVYCSLLLPLYRGVSLQSAIICNYLGFSALIFMPNFEAVVSSYACVLYRVAKGQSWFTKLFCTCSQVVPASI